MFDLGAGELLVIGIVALVVIGPKELPGVLRQAGKFTSKMRKMAGEFRSQFDEAMRESELDDAKKHIDEMKEKLKNQIENINPVSLAQNHAKNIENTLNSPVEVVEIQDFETEKSMPMDDKNFEPQIHKRKRILKAKVLREGTPATKRASKKIKQVES